jgi:hypothetical protein
MQRGLKHIVVKVPPSIPAQKLRDTGHCVLKNVKVGKELYNGDCRITQEEKEYASLAILSLWALFRAR